MKFSEGIGFFTVCILITFSEGFVFFTILGFSIFFILFVWATGVATIGDFIDAWVIGL